MTDIRPTISIMCSLEANKQIRHNTVGLLIGGSIFLAIIATTVALAPLKDKEENNE